MSRDYGERMVVCREVRFYQRHDIR